MSKKLCIRATLNFYDQYIAENSLNLCKSWLYMKCTTLHLKIY